ncbi:expressed unknown protein [Seminavis robusta]|uniref:Uncharacterized protein n=1 Tax=Seminavis robusta TaxID=568900 RepID=A0A9N8HX06_9STRA|nr:expressed unknown protein [Seminavis robusta]|eukprot:Sro2326_g323410.1 n/a (339) ;mRNA; r:1805-2821
MTKDPASSASEDLINVTVHQENPSNAKQREPPPARPPSVSATTEYSARRAATRPIRQEEEDFRLTPSKNTSISGTFRSNRMKNHSLVQQVEYLSIQNSNQQSSFETLLKLEDERRQQIASAKKANDQPTPIFWSILGSSVLLAISSFLWDPSSAQSLWKTVLNKKFQAALAVAWLPWVWAHPGKLALVDLLIIVQFMRQPAMLPYLQYEVVPIIGKTIRTMLLTELWTRTWKWFFPQWDKLRSQVAKQLKTKDNDDNPSSGSNQQQYEPWTIGHVSWPQKMLGDPPSWLVETHKFLVGGVRRGIKSAFKKSIQETLMTSFSVWKAALEEQIIARLAVD